MNESKTTGIHPDENALWRWHRKELDRTEAAPLEQHLQSCVSCQQRAEAIGSLIHKMQKMHLAVQPTLAEQMHLLRALKAQFAPDEKASVLVGVSQRLVRWLAPAVAILAALFVLFRNESTSSTDVLAELLPEAPESRLLTAATDEQFQQAMLELAFSDDENGK
jgi:hypothetical protein